MFHTQKLKYENIILGEKSAPCSQAITHGWQMASERVVNPQISAPDRGGEAGYVRHWLPGGRRHVIIPVIFYKQHQVINGQSHPAKLEKKLWQKTHT